MEEKLDKIISILEDIQYEISNVNYNLSLSEERVKGDKLQKTLEAIQTALEHGL